MSPNTGHAEKKKELQKTESATKTAWHRKWFGYSCQSVFFFLNLEFLSFVCVFVAGLTISTIYSNLKNVNCAEIIWDECNTCLPVMFWCEMFNILSKAHWSVYSTLMVVKVEIVDNLKISNNCKVLSCDLLNRDLHILILHFGGANL